MRNSMNEHSSSNFENASVRTEIGIAAKFQERATGLRAHRPLIFS
jgi:hypothetical protein